MFSPLVFHNFASSDFHDGTEMDGTSFGDCGLAALPHDTPLGYTKFHELNDVASHFRDTGSVVPRGPLAQCASHDNAECLNYAS